VSASTWAIPTFSIPFLHPPTGLPLPATASIKLFPSIPTCWRNLNQELCRPPVFWRVPPQGLHRKGKREDGRLTLNALYIPVSNFARTILCLLRIYFVCYYLHMKTTITPSQFVKRRRKFMGLTQSELAKEYGNGVRQYYISKWETEICAVPAEFVLWLLEKTGWQKNI
jgi:hypothetical protein